MHFFVRPILFTARVFVLLMKIAKIFAVFFFSVVVTVPFYVSKDNK